MKNRSSKLCLVLGGVLVWGLGHAPVGVSQAPQQPTAPNDSKSVPEAPKKTAPPPANGKETPTPRDPTQPSQKIREILDRPTNGPGSESGPTMPTITLKGRVLGGLAPPTALLEINGSLRTVRSGSKLGLGGNLILHVKDISSLGVEIEIEPSKQTINLQ
ncbi:MAG: hypothetical protein ACK4RK_02330 [Gemmataceae bacterium]